MKAVPRRNEDNAESLAATLFGAKVRQPGHIPHAGVVESVGCGFAVVLFCWAAEV
jgi:hypothetical protein